MYDKIDETRRNKTIILQGYLKYIMWKDNFLFWIPALKNKSNDSGYYFLKI